MPRTSTVTLGDLSGADAASVPLDATAGGGRRRTEPLIRVRIRASVEEATLSDRGSWVVAQAGARTGRVLEGPARVVSTRGGIKIVDAAGRVSGFPRGQSVYAARRSVSGLVGAVRVDDAGYPGTLLLVPEQNGAGDRFDVVNVTGIESYLPGVLSRELYSHWHESAFSVQAVAARTFALGRRERTRRGGRHYDVEATTADQVYGGVTGLAVAQRAVAITRGVVLVDDERLAQAYYSSTCGGRPGLADETWPDAGAVPGAEDFPTVSAEGASSRVALTSRSGSEQPPRSWRDALCDDAPRFRWTVARDTGQLAARLAAWGRSRGDAELAAIDAIRSIEVAQVGAAGRPASYRIVGAAGSSATVTAERLRLACNFSDGRTAPPHPRSAVHSNDMSFEVGPRVTTIRGRGHGHGVGLCQFCAQAMALRGDHWRQMASAFYPEAEIRRVY